MAISLNEALAITDRTDVPFDIKFVALDLSRCTGGALIELKNCRRVGASHMMKDHDTICVKQNDRNTHPYVIHQPLIQEINGQEIYL